MCKSWLTGLDSREVHSFSPWARDSHLSNSIVSPSSSVLMKLVTNRMKTLQKEPGINSQRLIAVTRFWDPRNWSLLCFKGIRFGIHRQASRSHIKSDAAVHICNSSSCTAEWKQEIEWTSEDKQDFPLRTVLPTRPCYTLKATSTQDRACMWLSCPSHQWACLQQIHYLPLALTKWLSCWIPV